MARVTCAISGIRFNVSYLEDISIPHTAGYFHPIFALSYKSLHHLYTRHCRNELTSNDSYLLFLAFLHSSGQIEWDVPASLNPNDKKTKSFIENNLAQLIEVLEKTGIIFHPAFNQPSFRINQEGSFLEQVPSWIKAWQNNIKDFYLGRASIREREELQTIENRLSKHILSGEKPKNFSYIIASWASKAADFPIAKIELWEKTIRSCFNTTKMFNTPLALLKEIKDYCECNIEVGSIHFHTLSTVLKEGIKRNVDYLGGSSLALGYTLLDIQLSSEDKVSEAKNEAELLTIASSAPEVEPKEQDYPTSLAFLKAKLAFRVATNLAIRKTKLKRL